MDIPMVFLAPSDPKLPSLLQFPAEIRNRISEYIFVRPEPILIHNADFYYNRRPYRPEAKSSTLFDEHALHSDGKEHGYQSSNKRCNKGSKRWEMRLDAEKEDAQLFRHEASLGLGLLKLCRQIYYETGSILYSDNTFVVSRVHYSHDPACEGRECRDYHQPQYAPIWLASLGSQIKRLKKVVVAISEHPYAAGGGYPDLLPLLRMIWDGTLMRCDLTFAYTGRRTGSGPRANIPQWLMATATRLNRSRAALTKDDTLHLRRHSTSKSLMPSPQDLFQWLQCHRAILHRTAEHFSQF